MRVAMSHAHLRMNCLLGACSQADNSYEDAYGECRDSEQASLASLSAWRTEQKNRIDCRVLAHKQTYLCEDAYGECRDSEQASLASLSVWRNKVQEDRVRCGERFIKLFM